MTHREHWRKFFVSTPCDCDPYEASSNRCNLSGWIRCKSRLSAWRAYRVEQGLVKAPPEPPTTTGGPQ